MGRQGHRACRDHRAYKDLRDLQAGLKDHRVSKDQSDLRDPSDRVAHRARQARRAHRAYKVIGVHKDFLEQPDLRDRQACKGQLVQPGLRDHGVSRAMQDR